MPLTEMKWGVKGKYYLNLDTEISDLFDHTNLVNDRDLAL